MHALRLTGSAQARPEAVSSNNNRAVPLDYHLGFSGSQRPLDGYHPWPIAPPAVPYVEISPHVSQYGLLRAERSQQIEGLNHTCSKHRVL